jgi:hypothetical protein
MPHGCAGTKPQEGGWDTGVGRPRSILPINRILNENCVASIAGFENSAQNEFGEFTSMEKYTHLLLTERIQQSQKFDKV